MRARLLVCALIVSALGVSACSDSSGTLPTTTVADTTQSGAAPTIADSTIAPTTIPDITIPDITIPDTTIADTTAVPDTSTTTTTTPPTTIAHGAGVISVTPDGTPVNAAQLAAAQSVYDAAVAHDYDRLKSIIGDRRFRWGFVGERGPTEAWKEQFDTGKGDELARMVTLLETPPAIDSQGNAVSLWHMERDEV